MKKKLVLHQLENEQSKAHHEQRTSERISLIFPKKKKEKNLTCMIV